VRRSGATTHTRLVAVIVLVATFLVGATAGWDAARWARHGEWWWTRGSAPSAHQEQPRFLDRLDLTSAQRARVDTILERRRAQMDAFRRGPGRQFRAILDSTRAEIRAVLTPAQQHEFDQMHRHHRRPE